MKKIIDKKFKLKNQEELEFDDTKVKGELKGVDKRAHELKEQMEKNEAKLKTSLRSKKGGPAKGLINEDDAVVLERRKNSDDEEDEFFDRTKLTAFNSKQAGGSSLKQEAQVETYESIKVKLEQLVRERQRITDEIHTKKFSGLNKQGAEEEEDELDAYMKKTELALQLDHQKKLGEQVKQLNLESEKYTKLIALVAPATVSHKATHMVEEVVEEPVVAHKKHHNAQSINSTLERLKHMSEQREAELEEQKRREEDYLREVQER